ncbi:MAG: TonB-dependent receptor plug domain-containing protein, partial [Phenylobacterium sp.]|nr:TonB-dependent receptor plug domain-containing protein [Phenylobacterium sp.]
MSSVSHTGLRRLLAASASVAVLASAGAAAAQSAAPAVEPFTIQELVITAEKREQALQDVPVAVSAFTSEQRDTQGITNIQDFVNFTPGMNYSGADRVSLRGSGRNTFYIGNDPGV